MVRNLTTPTTPLPREPASANAKEKKVMSNDITTITNGVISYDVTQAKPAVDARITELFAESADLVVAGVQTLAVMENINPQIKIEAVTLAAQNWQDILDAVYAGRPLPTSGYVAKTKSRVVRETPDTEPKEAPVHPALQELANLLYDGDTDQTLNELLDMFAAFAELSPQQRDARYTVAQQVLSGDLEVDDRGVLKLASELAEVRRQLKKAEADKAAAEGRVNAAREDGKREAERGLTGKLAAAKREGKQEAEEGLRDRIAAAKADGKREGEQGAATKIAAAKAEGKREGAEEARTALEGDTRRAREELTVLRERVAALQPVLDKLAALSDDEEAQRALLASILAAAEGQISIEETRRHRQSAMPALRDIAAKMGYGRGDFAANHQFKKFDQRTRQVLASLAPQSDSE